MRAIWYVPVALVALIFVVVFAPFRFWFRAGKQTPKYHNIEAVSDFAGNVVATGTIGASINNTHNTRGNLLPQTEVL